ncbi:hypothetical protein ACFVU2_01185 [Leifsonia sp. NPDC058194]|uniref:hypothetical protein n=1 Tax=Leifsonia sp. NPDC058194 TaxID=3346374 RepID=UPI0036DD1345
MSSEFQETSRVEWHTPVDGLWVAETPSDYLGMVDLGTDGFVGTGATGQDLGVFPTLQGAQLAVYARWFLNHGTAASVAAEPETASLA